MSQYSDSHSNAGLRNTPKLVIYFCQVAAIFAVIVACVVNLSIGNDKAELWSSLLSGALGYLLPSPKLRKNDSLLHNSSVQQLQEILSRQHSHSLQNKTVDENDAGGGMGSGSNGDYVSQNLAHCG